jgi:pyruvate ferredoxin oxidoreductase beta subunit
MDLHKLARQKERFTSGHRLCAGCGAGVVVHQTMLACEDENVVVINATGCVEVTTTIYPTTAWNVPWIHGALENAGAVASGVDMAYKSLKKQGRINDDIKFVVLAGDGGTYDIGLQSLSGMLERSHDVLYICYNNEAYMNTGYQRSGATPIHAETTTRPWGKKIHGKPIRQKNLTKIIEAHNIPFVAQAATAFDEDYIEKVRLGLAIEGPAFINVLSPCRLGWGHPSNMAYELSRLAVETCFWPLYEIRNGRFRVNYHPHKVEPLENFLRYQKRFAHIMEPKNKKDLEELKKIVSDEWETLKQREHCDRVCTRITRPKIE